MSRFYSYLNTALSIIESFDGRVPFSVMLKDFFSKNNKYGSRDRKEIASICYAYYRTGHLFDKDKASDKLLKSVFLCSVAHSSFLAALRPEWNEKISSSVEEKLKLLNADEMLQGLFTWEDELSKGIDARAFRLSNLIQPDLFVRIRTGMGDEVLTKLERAGTPYAAEGQDCLRFANGINIDPVLDLDKEAVIQDYSSQRTGELLRKLSEKKIKTVWDCCAASGGKSIMAVDILGDIDLTVSDVRESILANLKKRFAKAGIKKYKCFIADLTKDDTIAQQNKFDLVIADVPCSGSGTWSRTPEQLFYFDDAKIETYSALQKKILSNVIPAVRPGGFLLYITCSVFAKENEDVIDFITQPTGLVLMKSVLLKGYEMKADTMFAALLQKTL